MAARATLTIAERTAPMMLLPMPELERPTLSEVDYAPTLDRLASSAFRRRKRLLGTELEQLRARGLEEVVAHAADFVAARLAPAEPANDGRQTPYRGHPVFIAQHATATCCRGCLETWHGIEKGRALTQAEVAWVVGLLGAWLCRETGATPPAAPPANGSTPRRPRPRRPAAHLKLVVPGEEAEPGPLVLEERQQNGELVRRWLQLELFGGD